jgi:uncharacterized coiled-coil DUF342 family protein
MGDLDTRCEKCEREMEQLRAKVADVIELVSGVIARVDEVLAQVQTSNRQMLSDLQAQTKAGFAILRSEINALPLPLSERRKDEPPKLN